MVSFLLLYLIVSHIKRISTQDLSHQASEDHTLTPKKVGTDVVEAVVDKIQSACFFDDDKGFLRRLALVDTNDGLNVSSSEPATGPWRITQQMLEQTIHKPPPIVERLTVKINSIFGFWWKHTTMAMLEKPFYSGLAMRLYLEVLKTKLKIDKKSYPTTIAEQAAVWAKYIRPGANEKVYILRASEKEFECRLVRLADLLLVLDESGSIGANNFEKVRNFALRMADTLVLGKNQSHLGIINFASHARVVYGLANTQSNELSEGVIRNMTYQRGRTNTAEALKLMMKEVKNHARADDGVPMFVIVVTDGASNVKRDTIEAAKKVHERNLLVYSIGVGPKYSLDVEELDRIASFPSCSHRFLISSFDEFLLFQKEIARKLSHAPNVLTNTGDVGFNSFSTSLRKDEKYHVKFVIGASGLNLTFTLPPGDQIHQVSGYFSRRTRTPSVAFYDRSILCSPTSPTQVLYYSPSLAGETVYGTLTMHSSGTSWDKNRSQHIDPMTEEEIDTDVKQPSRTDCVKSSDQADYIPFKIEIKTQCLPGQWGSSCENVCHCKGGTICDPISGYCPDCDCQTGWYGNNCEFKCPQGSWGKGCSERCNCATNDGCDIITGECPGECARGWTTTQLTDLLNLKDKQNESYYPERLFTPIGKKVCQVPDRDHCDWFWFCEGAIYGTRQTCQTGLHWLEGTNKCVSPEMAKCPNYPLTVPTTTTNDMRHHQIISFIKNKVTRDECKKHIFDQYEDEYKCPPAIASMTVSDLSSRLRMDFFRMANEGKNTRNNFTGTVQAYLMKQGKFALYKHDRFDTGKFIGTDWGICDSETIFNNDWTTCSSVEKAYHGMSSTHPDPALKQGCNDLINGQPIRAINQDVPESIIYEHWRQYNQGFKVT
ncbi:unnamed protein product [Didymodactylos carnosus]|uniref:VWFA domain-containing protein n=1 Tax=Didymodactylos carnosus TaxID=1234261 RepID=A0A8S2KLD3_9BILA|nr:unnamed protein product [Didymodactylos carnosus]CAF3854743.1 unnamed protein product [Didymodactylos carnosus]